jgi:hypothetical protein
MLSLLVLSLRLALCILSDQNKIDETQLDELNRVARTRPGGGTLASSVESLLQFKFLDFSDSVLDDDDIGPISSLPEIQSLVLSRTNIGDPSCKQIGQMKNLTYISFSETRITDAGISDITRLPSLSSLDLTGTRITGVTFSHLHEVIHNE